MTVHEVFADFFFASRSLLVPRDVAVRRKSIEAWGVYVQLSFPLIAEVGRSLLRMNAGGRQDPNHNLLIRLGVAAVESE